MYVFFPSVLMEQLDSHWTDFHEIWYWIMFLKSVQKIQVPLISDKNNGYFTWPIYIFDHISLILLRMRNVLDKSSREDQNTHFIINRFLFRKLCRLWDNLEKCSNVGQATDDNMAQATFQFFTTTQVSRTRLTLTFYAPYPSCLRWSYTLSNIDAAGS